MPGQTLYFKASNMTCHRCEGHLEGLIQSLPFVESCSASHMDSLLTVILKADTPESKMPQIIKQLEDEGEANELEFMPPLHRRDSEPESSKPYFQHAAMNLGMLALWMTLTSIFPLSGIASSLILGTIVHTAVFGHMLWTGGEFLSDAWQKLKHKQFNMNTLVALSLVTAFSTSLLGLYLPGYFGAQLFHLMPIFMVNGMVNLGRGIRHHVELKAKRAIKQSEEAFAKLIPLQANKKVSDKTYVTISYEEIKPGDVLHIEASARIPTEGVLLSDEAILNRKHATGESLAATIQKGEVLLSGSLNMRGPILMRATKPVMGSECVKMLLAFRRAKASKPSSFQWVDAISSRFVPFVMGVAAVSATMWSFMMPAMAMNSAISVLLCACPCALGLAAPMSLAMSLSHLFKRGILVNDADALKSLAEVDTLVFDKTGTLTQPCVRRSKIFGQYPIKQLAASLEKNSEHPIAQAIKAYHTGDTMALSELKSHDSGQGVQGQWRDKSILIGNEALMRSEGIPLEEQHLKHLDPRCTPIYIAVAGKIEGLFQVQHQLKPNVREVLEQLKPKYKLVLLTGDSQGSARILQGLPFDEVHVEQSIEDKKEKIQAYKALGQKVAYLGDGMNDGMAAQASHVSLAMRSDTHLALQAQISLTGDIKDLPYVIEEAERTQRNIKQNLAWTFFYNTISLLTASGALYPLLGFSLNPAIFAGTMALSSLFVVCNALRLSGSADERTHGLMSAGSSSTVSSSSDPDTQRPSFKPALVPDHQGPDKDPLDIRPVAKI